MQEIYNLLSLIAGTQPLEFVTSRLRSFLGLDLPDQTKSIIQHYISCSEEGGYPAPSYLQQFSLYSNTLPVIASEAELSVYINSVSKLLTNHSFRSQVIKALNSDDLVSELRTVMDSGSSTEVSYDFTNSVDDGTSVSSDINSGVYEIDDITRGFIGGTVATFAAFTSHGKSTACVSAAYKNMKKGKTVCYFSLELPPMIVIKQFFVRWLYEEHNVICTFSDLLSDSMDAPTKTRVAALRPVFNDYIKDKLIILDESVLSKAFISDYRLIKSVYSDVADRLGGQLDIVIYDHVGQIELMHPDKGNSTLKNITSAGKTFTNPDGTLPVTLWACQTNRTGYERALRRQGKYDLLAIGDLNEVERSSSYVIFLFKENEAVVQELKITMAKHRYGALIPEPVSVAFNPAIYTVGAEFEMSSGSGVFSSVFDTAMGGFEMPTFDSATVGTSGDAPQFKFKL